MKQVEDTHITLANAFEIADDVLRRGVQSVSELINVPGFINLDFADVTTIMKNAGYAHMGVGAAKGEDKAQLASMAAISSPLLETSIAGAMGVLVCITASQDIQLDEVNLASQMIYEEAHPDATIIWGATLDPTLEDEMRVTIIATGFDQVKSREASARTQTAEEQKTRTVEEEVESIARSFEPAPVKEEAPAEIKIELAPEEPVYKKPETIATTIPSQKEKSEFDYGDVFSCIKRLKK